MKKPFLLANIVFLLSLGFQPTFASVPTRHKVNAKKPHAHIQQHYSFLPPPKPLTGWVSHQNNLPALEQVNPPLSTSAPVLPHAPAGRVIQHQEEVYRKPVMPDTSATTLARQPRVGAGKHWGSRKALTDIPQRSWVTDVSAAQAPIVADNIARFAALELSPAQTAVLLAPARQKHNPLSPTLQAALNQSGFALCNTHAQCPSAPVLQYQINKLNNGLLLRITFNHRQATRYFAAGMFNTLSASAPFAVQDGVNTP